MNIKNKKRICTALTFSLLLILMTPLQVSAAGEQITEEITIIAADMKDAKAQAEQKFDTMIEKDRTDYELTDIKYIEVDTIYLDKKEKVVELKEEPKQTMTESGVEYTLKTSEKTEKVVQESSQQQVAAYDDYDTPITASDVLGTKTVTVTNQLTGAAEQVVCSFSGISDAGTIMAQNTMTITISDYDAAYYEWNGNYIPRNDEVPPLAGYEASLLASVGAAEGSVITGYYWSSEPYTVDGVMYRDASATVEQPVRMYRANYIGSITNPEKKETVYKAVYETPDEDGLKEIKMRAVATYTEAEKSYVPYIIAGVGIFLLLLLIVLIIFIIAKRKKGQKEEGAINSTKKEV